MSITIEILGAAFTLDVVDVFYRMLGIAPGMVLAYFLGRSEGRRLATEKKDR